MYTNLSFKMLHCEFIHSFIYFQIELNNRYDQIRKSVKMGYKGHYNAYMKSTIVQCQFDNTVGWLLYICSNFISIVSTARLLIYI